MTAFPASPCLSDTQPCKGPPPQDSAEWTSVAARYPAGWLRPSHGPVSLLERGLFYGFLLVEVNIAEAYYDPSAGQERKRLTADVIKCEGIDSNIGVANRHFFFNL